MTQQLRMAASPMFKVDLLAAGIGRDSRKTDQGTSRALGFAAGTHVDLRVASIFVTAPDGLTLHVRSYGSRVGSALPVVCLPGLARTAADFHPLAAGLAAEAKPALGFEVDFRG